MAYRQQLLFMVLDGCEKSTTYIIPDQSSPVLDSQEKHSLGSFVLLTRGRIADLLLSKKDLFASRIRLPDLARSGVLCEPLYTPAYSMQTSSFCRYICTPS